MNERERKRRSCRTEREGEEAEWEDEERGVGGGKRCK